MKETTLTIDSMVCQGCAEKISDILNEVVGVKNVKTKAMKKLVHIQFNPEETNKEKLIAVLTEKGYKSTVFKP